MVHLIAFTNGKIIYISYGKNIPVRNGHHQETMITRCDLEVKSQKIYDN